VTTHGLRREEAAGITIDRPYGLGCYLLLRFHSPMEVLTARGVGEVEPGQCIFFSPGHPQWYRGRGDAWVNDWMHIEGEGVPCIAHRCGVPLNTPLKPHDTRFLPRLFEEIWSEQFHKEPQHEEAVELLARQLLLKLGRALRDPVAQFTAAEAAHLPALRALRQRLHDDFSHHWTISEMAAIVGFSTSRFAALYQRLFGASPGEELLRARMQNAEHLLTNRAITVQEVSRQCGFRSVNYFSRVFHQRIGCAPRDYHRRENSQQSLARPAQ
jgi:AraC-like DNA-binding protein